MSFLRLRAHSKLNLALHVGARRDDGYHPIAGVFQTISLCDLLYAAAAERGRTDLLELQVVGAEIPADNTVRAAVEKLAEEARRQRVEPAPIRMTLVKRVPMGSGLGGGSSDAAAALAACVRLWELDQAALLEADALPRIAAEIGSDVPFFLHGGTAMVTGRGERVAGLEPLQDTWFVVATPELHVSTPVAYAEFDRAAARSDPGASDVRPGPSADYPEESAVGPPLPRYAPRPSARWVHNDLQDPVSACYPGVAAVCRRLVELGAETVQMTGSGAASFGTFADRRVAARTARILRLEGRWAGAFVSVGRQAHRDALFGRS